MNDMIKVLATEENALLADTEAAFRAAGDLSKLFSDDVHPNDAGYQVVAQASFRAITGRAAASAALGPHFLYVAPATAPAITPATMP